VGISGVNFGVAETGTLCIVTNEGTWPHGYHHAALHIALMGMERILPTLDDLGPDAFAPAAFRPPGKLAS